jgi:PAS domain S-box-containing protein
MLFIHETTTPPTSRSLPNRYSIPLFLALIAAGLTGNYFKFPLFLNIDFLFGSIFAMLALQFFGLGRGIAAAALIASYTYVLWNHPYAIVIMTAEVAVVGWLMGYRKMGMVLADTLYWLIIGMPLVYVFYHLVMQVPISNTDLALTKQAVNGIANALVARLVFTGYALRSRSSLISYREIVYNLLAFFALCPALIVLAIGGRTDFATTDRHIRTQLTQDSRRVADRLEIWVVNRKTAIVNLAEMAASKSPQQMQPYLEQAKKADINFKRIGLLNREATSTAFFPLLDELGQRNIGKNFADRPFIPTLKQTLKPMLSEVVMSKIGTPKPMVAMLAPVVMQGEYAGYVAGILGMQQIQDHLDKSTEENAALYTLIDKNGHVIMTNRSDQKVMTPFVRGKGTLNLPDDTGVRQWVPAVPHNTPISERWHKSFYVAETVIGDLAEWKLVLEQPVAPFQKQLVDNYTGKLTMLFLILLGGLALAELLSRLTVVTLDQLRLITRDLPGRLETECKEIAWPESGIVEAHQLIDNFREMADSLSDQFMETRRINESLEQRVEERTLQVAQLANEQRIILSTMPIGACLLRERKVELANPAFDKILGYETGETLGMHASAFFPDAETYERLGAVGYAELAKGSIFTTDTKLRQKNGSLIWCSIAGQSVNAEQPENGAIWMVEDITDRKAMEHELIVQRENYRTVADFTYDWEYWIKPDGAVFYCSPACERITGYIAEEFTNNPDLLTEIVHPDDFAIIKRHLTEDLYNKNEPYELEYRAIKRSGEIIWISHVCQAVFSNDGTYQGRRSSNRDITSRKNAEQLLRSASIYTRTLIEASPDPLVTINAEGKITDVNDASVTVTGIPREQLIGTDFSARFTDPEKAREGYLRVFSDGVVQDYPLAIRHVSGGITHVLYNASIYRDEEGNVKGVFAAARDVTERIKAEEKIRTLNEELENRVRERTAELERMNRELEGFCYSISHELRAPLARLNGFSELAAESARHSDMGGVVHCAERINVASQRLRTVIDALLTLTRLSRSEIQLSPVNLTELTMQIVAELREQNNNRIMTFTISPGIVVQGDRDMLEICLRNLLGNAVKYTSNTAEASISFGAHCKDGATVYFVRDNGVGFDMNHAKNLFVPFCRLHSEAEFEGSGIGLATVQRIIDRHNGRIWAEAVPGNGATFYFTLGEPREQ